jgi:hypothetical protein
MTTEQFKSEALDIVVEEMSEEQLYANAGINSCASSLFSAGSCVSTVGTVISCADEQAIN